MIGIVNQVSITTLNALILQFRHIALEVFTAITEYYTKEQYPVLYRNAILAYTQNASAEAVNAASARI
jgi:hypothetical protein